MKRDLRDQRLSPAQHHSELRRFAFGPSELAPLTTVRLAAAAWGVFGHFSRSCSDV